MNYIVAQIFALIGMLVNVISLQYKNKNKIMISQLIANIMYTLQYIFLKAYTGAFSASIAILRSYFFKDKQSKKSMLLKSTLLILLFLIVSYFNYNNFISLIPIILGIITILSACFNKPRTYKLVYGLCSIVWIYYNYKMKAYICSIDCTMCAISAFIGYYKDRR